MKTLFSVIILIVLLNSGQVSAEERLRLATTTSTDNSGLLAVLHPAFEAKYDVKIDVIAVGTGKALRLGENGDVDVLLVHAPASEKEFISNGFGTVRLPVMHNDFVLLGPESDPAKNFQAKTITEALLSIAKSGSGFVSRGDDSGTHKKEISLWESINITPSGNWYMAAGQGMGAVIRIANDKLAYTLADRGTYLAFKDKIDLQIVFTGDEALFNPYHVILLNTKKHPHIKAELARLYAKFIRGTEGQRIISDFIISGERLFHPDVIQ
jgi:tungstate transport system substrate-binding protein